MDNILIVANKDGAILIEEMLKEQGKYRVQTCLEHKKIEGHLNNDEIDIIIINSNYDKIDGIKLAINISKRYKIGIILLIKNDMVEETYEMVSKYGIFVVDKPISKKFLLRGISFILAQSKRFTNLEREKDGLQRKIEEIHIINRAKYVLMQYLNLNEEQAHKYIEKQAMDLRKTKIKIAENILRTYDAY